MRDLDNTKHTDSEENATISSIKNALMWIVEEWVGFDVPEEDSEDYATWMIMLETVENFKTIDDLPEALDFFGMDYLDFIIEREYDLIDAGMDPQVIPRLVIEKLGFDIELDLDEELINTKLLSLQNAKGYWYGEKYFVFLSKDSEERLIFDDMDEALLSIGIDTSKECPEQSTPEVKLSRDWQEELNDLKSRISNAMKNRPRTTKYIIVTNWPGGTMAFKFGNALIDSLYVSKNETILVQFSPERIFRTTSQVTEQEFRETLSMHYNASHYGKIFFVDTGITDYSDTDRVNDISSESEAFSSKQVAEPLKRLVFASIGCSLIFMESDTAEELAKFWNDIRTSKTWGVFKIKSPDRYEDIIDRFYSDDQPGDMDPFPGTDIPGVNEGDYPGWPAQLMLNFMPREITDSVFAKIKDSVHNGRYLELDPKFEDVIVSILVSKGFEVTKNDDLIRRASGRG